MVVTCPHCQTTLNAAALLVPGQKLQCRQCGRPFQVAAGAARTSRTALGYRVAIGALALLTLAVVALGFYSFRGEPEAPAKATAREAAVFAEAPAEHDAEPSGGEKTEKATPVKQPTKAPAEPSRKANPSPPADPPSRPKPPPPADPGVRPQDTLRTVSAEEQKRINTAIDRGIAWLRHQQQADGGWGICRCANGDHHVALAALPGLTLLECGVARDDPAVQQAARLVRLRTPALSHTYDLALAILFLDRLGDKRDEALIGDLAARLIAGQHGDGGWTYECPLVSPQEAGQLQNFLRDNPPVALNNPLASTNKLFDLNPIIFAKPAASEQNRLYDPLPAIGPGQPVGGPDKGPKRKPAGAGEPPPAKPRLRFPQLSPLLRSLPVFTNRQLPILPAGPYFQGISDNSNSQFAMIALWVARRHGWPMARTMALVHKRYVETQFPDGSWIYRPGWAPGPAMTCVGLIGLALGHGSAREFRAAQAPAAPTAGKRPRPSLADPAIQRGLAHLGTLIGNPTGARVEPLQNLYFLWSVERVAVLYNLKTIGGKDWYGWEAEMLLLNQHPDGSWGATPYPGSNTLLDTCLALLILKRANLVPDLSVTLQDYLAITDPDAPATAP
jgi:hypothetical protein